MLKSMQAVLGAEDEPAGRRFMVTGANRGIGLELVSQLADAGASVLATARDPSEAVELKALMAQHGRRVRLMQLDLDDPGSVRSLGHALSTSTLDVLINNAGRGGSSGQPGAIDYDAMRALFETNVLGTLRVTEAALPALDRGDRKLLVHISSRMGSLAENTSGGGYAYRASKAALNMVHRSLALDLAPRGYTSVALHPGWVQTRMGGEQAPLSARRSVQGMLTVLDGLTPEANGGFFNFDGAVIPW